MKDAVATMGGLLPDDVGGRDAVHVAVLSAVASEKLAPGQDVGFADGFAANGERLATATRAPKLLGIVDPFLNSIVFPEQRFWVYLYPRTITGLNHQWTHPDIPADRAIAGNYIAPSQKLNSEQWLRDFCARSDCPDYETMISAIKGEWPLQNNTEDGYLNVRIDDEYLHFGGLDAHGEIPAEFWTHIENVIGRKIDRPLPTHFSCSC